MEVTIKWEHYPPNGTAKITLMGILWCRVFEFKVAGPEKEVERCVRNVIRRIKKLDVGANATNFAIHAIDQIVAYQREWNQSTSDADSNDRD